jgi:hypothetical protein
MRPETAILLLACQVGPAAAVLAQQSVANTPSTEALRLFDGLPFAEIESVLRGVRPAPLAAPDRARVRATLPRAGDLVPSPAEQEQLRAIEAVLVYHQRHHVFDIKLIDVPQAFVGLHGRAVLLISRPAMSLVSVAELQALVAHEVGHDFLWNEFEMTQRRRDRHARHLLEMQCDGIAALTLVALGLDPTRLTEAVKKLVWFNRRLGAVANTQDYPSLRDREAFVALLVRRTSWERYRTAAQQP